MPTDMPTHRLLRITFACLIGATASAAARPAHPIYDPPTATPATPAETKPSETKPSETKPSETKLPEIPDIVFFLAHGDANACGPGCDEWIAADGKIDSAAPLRLRRLLAKLGPRKPPIFFYSPGGSALGSIELGRLIRSRKMVAGVARTVPDGCDRYNPREKLCDELKRSGRDLISALDFRVTMCNSGCVYALIGGATRSVPPFVRLGIHSLGSDASKPPVRGAALAAAIRDVNSQIADYLHDMGIAPMLLTEALAVPYQSVKFLQRDELVKLGIDTREFGETDWWLVEKPRATIEKVFFVRTDNEQSPYRNAMLRLSCGSGKTMRVTLATELAPSEGILFKHPFTITVNGWKFDLSTGTLANASASTDRFFMRGVALPNDLLNLLESAGDAGAIEIYPKFPDRKNDWPGIVKLGMEGFSAAFVKLRKACG